MCREILVEPLSDFLLVVLSIEIIGIGECGGQEFRPPNKGGFIWTAFFGLQAVNSFAANEFTY